MVVAVMSSIMMSIEGVLGTGEDFVTMLPNNEGIKLFRTLNREYQIQLVTSEWRMDKIQHWLQLQGIQEYGGTWGLPPDMVEDDRKGNQRANSWNTEIRKVQLRMLRSSRVPISMVIDSDFLFVREAAMQGISGMLYMPAAFAAERTDLTPQPIRTWEQMQASR